MKRIIIILLVTLGISTQAKAFDLSSIIGRDLLEINSVFKNKSVLYWVSNSNSRPVDEGGIVIPGSYIGLGTIIEPTEESNSVYFNARVLMARSYGELPPPGWRTFAEKGELIRVCRNSLSSGKLQDYIDFIKGINKAALEHIVDLKISNNYSEQMISFWDGFPSLHKNIIEYFERKEFDLGLRVENDIYSVFYLISYTEKGRDFLSDFLPQYMSGHIKVRSVRSREAFEVPMTENAIAFYWVGTVYVDFLCDLTRLLPVFIHEGTHALDLTGTDRDHMWEHYSQKEMEYRALMLNLKNTEYNDETKDDFQRFSNLDRELSSLRKNRYSIEVATEHKAFRAQENFLAQMTEIFPEYDVAISDLSHSKRWMTYPIDEGTFKYIMISEYLIPDSYVEEHFSTTNWEDYN